MLCLCLSHMFISYLLNQYFLSFFPHEKMKIQVRSGIIYHRMKIDVIESREMSYLRHLFSFP